MNVNRGGTRIGTNKTASSPDVEAVGIWEPDPVVRAAAQGKAGFAGARWFDSADQVLGDPSVVAVAIEGRNHESLGMALEEDHHVAPLVVEAIGQGYATLFQLFILRFGVFVSSALILSQAFRGEILEKTMHFYLLAPVRRELVAIGKYLAGVIFVAALFTSTTIASPSYASVTTSTRSPIAVRTPTIRSPRVTCGKTNARSSARSTARRSR